MLVQLRTDSDAITVANQERTAGAHLSHQFTKALHGFAATLSSERIAALKRDKRVLAVEPDAVIHVDTTEANPTWGLDRIDQRSGQDNSYSYDTTGAGVTAFVVDTGIWATHQEFTGRILPGYDFVDGDSAPTDCNGHGTHVSGTIGGTTYGVAKNVAIVPLRVFNCAGSGYASDVIAAFDYSINHRPPGPAVLNFSGGGGFSAAVNAAVNAVAAAGIVPVVAAGNSSADACLSSPSSANGAFTVGATDSTDARAWFSNYGPCVGIFAPGVSVLSAYFRSDSAVASMSGTSMAAPHVTGVVARYLQAHPASSVASTIAAIKAQANPAVRFSSSPTNGLVYADPGSTPPPPPPVTAPGVPTAVSATAASSTATLSWSPPVSDGNSAITGYRVSRDGVDTVGNGPWSTTIPASVRSFPFTSLEPSTSYVLSVQAINSAGDSAPASVVVTTAAPPAPSVPGAPTSVGASATLSTATLTWSPPTDSGTSAITGYKVARDGIDTVGKGPWSTTIPATARWFQFTLLQPATTCVLTVQAINSEGLGTPTSVVLTTPAAPAVTVPAAPTSLTGSATATTATLSWLPPADTGNSPITGYKVTRDETDTAGKGPWSTTVPAAARWFQFTLLKPGTAYVLSVQAVNPQGEGIPATVVVNTAAAPQPPVVSVPGAPSSVSATTTGSTATVSWAPPGTDGNSAVTGYKVARDGTDTSGAGLWSTTLPATGRWFQFAKLKAGTAYTLTVQAINAAGEGAPASVVVTTAAPPPPVRSTARITLTPARSVVPNGVVTFSVVVSPPASGRTVVLQRRSGSSWVRVMAGKTNAAGRADFKATIPRSTVYRAVASAAGHSTGATSKTVQVRVALPKARRYASCRALNAAYPHGVGRSGAHDRTTGRRVTVFTVYVRAYQLNSALDYDHDGISCERF